MIRVEQWLSDEATLMEHWYTRKGTAAGGSPSLPRTSAAKK